MAVNKYFCALDINEDEEDNVNQAEMEQIVQEVNAIVENVQGMNVAVENAIKNLRESADYLDQVSKDCKLASACGSSAGILGGLLTVGGAVAIFMTAGAAAPLLIVGTAFSAAGACTNLGSNILEACTNNSLTQAADGAVENANRAIKDVREKIRLLKDGKSQLRLVFLAGLASRMLGTNHLAVLFIKSLVRPDLLAKTLSKSGVQAVSELALRLGVTEVATAATRELIETGSREAISVGVNAGARKVGNTGAFVARKVSKKIVGPMLIAVFITEMVILHKYVFFLLFIFIIVIRASRKAGTKAGAKVLSKAGSKTASNAGNVAVKEGASAVGKVGTKLGGSLIIGASAAFLVLDAMELTFTVRDIINVKGSDAARCLRDRADELEAILHV